MKSIWIAILGSALIWGAAAQAEDAETCANILASGSYKTVLRLAHELNPTAFPSADQPVPLEKLYLQLKEEEWANPPFDQLREQLMAARQDRYRIEEMNEEDLRQFYSNAVRGLYVRVADMWLTQEVQIQVGSVMKPELEAVLKEVINDQFGLSGMDARALKPDNVRANFSERPWMRLPWLSIAQFLLEFKERYPGKYPGTDFSRFWDERATHYRLPSNLYEPLYAALGSGDKPPVCCVSTPGCVHCPNNRRWLKKKAD